MQEGAVDGVIAVGAVLALVAFGLVIGITVELMQLFSSKNLARSSASACDTKLNELLPFEVFDTYLIFRSLCIKRCVFAGLRGRLGGA